MEEHTKMNDENNNNNINNIYDPITRKLTSAARRTLQQELAGLPGVPPVAPRIARKNAELLQPFSDNPVQQALWEDIIVPYARYCTEWDKICAILPAYLLDGTNGTHIYYIDGTYEILRNRITWVLDDLLEYLLTSKAILERHSIRWMGGIDRRRVPLVVNDTFCLVPVTCRAAERRNDGTTGYVVLKYIHQVLPGYAWRSCHRDEEDLLSDYDNVLNRPKSKAEEVSILVLKADDTKSFRVRDAYKLALRDSSLTVQSNIYLAHRMLGVREYALPAYT